MPIKNIVVNILRIKFFIFNFNGYIFYSFYNFPATTIT